MKGLKEKQCKTRGYNFIRLFAKLDRNVEKIFQTSCIFKI